jgi:hypothetical protein
MRDVAIQGGDKLRLVDGAPVDVHSIDHGVPKRLARTFPGQPLPVPDPEDGTSSTTAHCRIPIATGMSDQVREPDAIGV